LYLSTQTFFIMTKYGVNLDLLNRLIEKVILEKNNLFRDCEIHLEEKGKQILIYLTFYVDNRELAKQEEIYYNKLKELYGSLDEVPDEDYRYFDDYLITEVLYVPMHKILFKGMGLDRSKYRLIIDFLE
jgi:hypothetical protein